MSQNNSRLRSILFLALLLGWVGKGWTQAGELRKGPDAVQPDSVIRALVGEVMVLIQTDHQMAEARAIEAFHLGQQQGDVRLRFMTVTTLGNCWITLGKHAQAIGLFEEELARIGPKEKVAYAPDVMRLLNNHAAAYSYLGGYSEAIRGFAEATRLAHQIGDTFNEGRGLHNLGISFKRLGKERRAEILLRQALDLKIQAADSLSIVSTFLALAELASARKAHSEAFSWLEKARNSAQTLGDTYQLIDVLYQRAGFETDLKNWEKAEEDLELVQQMADSLGYRVMLPSARIALAQVYGQTGRGLQGKEVLEKALGEARLVGNPEVLKSGLETLAQLHAESGEWRAAFGISQEIEAIKDSLWSKQANLAAERLDAQFRHYQLNSRVAQVRQREEKALADRNRILLLSGVGILAMLLFAWRERQFFQGRKAFLEAELKLKNQELALAQQELVAFTAVLREKNTLIGKLEARADSGEGSPIPFEELVQMKILTEEDWREFQILFSRAYPHFISDLREQYPQITLAEQRLILLIKLNMARKEIADILGVSPQTVKVTRYRLRKKLDLEKEDRLEDFVDAL